MFFHLVLPWASSFSILNVLRYPSFRILMAALTALILSVAAYPPLIRRLQVFKYGQVVRKDGPESHFQKQGTPTMGGVLILLSLTLSTLLWARLDLNAIWILLFVTLGYGVVGFVDDYRKIRYKSTDGLAGRWKMFWLGLIGLIAILLYVFDYASIPFTSEVIMPFVPRKYFSPVLPIAIYIGLAWLLLVGTSNAVNLTDGLDGLAIGPTIVSASVFLILAYIAGTTVGSFDPAEYLGIQHIEGGSELSVFCAALVGAGIGFLWYNSYPALIFMGDVGALALGGALGMLALFTKHELLSALLHGLFLVEALSVMIQVFWFKRTGQRVFRMAPLHHHFEELGWPEPRVIVRFWIVSVMLGLLALASLKLR